MAGDHKTGIGDGKSGESMNADRERDTKRGAGNNRDMRIERIGQRVERTAYIYYYI